MLLFVVYCGEFSPLQDASLVTERSSPLMKATFLAAVAAMGLLLPLAGAGETNAQGARTDGGVGSVDASVVFAPEPPTVRFSDGRGLPTRDPNCGRPRERFFLAWQEPYTRGNPTHETALRRDLARRIAQERGRFDPNLGIDAVEEAFRSRAARPAPDGGLGCPNFALMFSAQFLGSAFCGSEPPTASQAVPGTLQVQGVTCRP